jgi:diguanylate cyclase (GGDEF)-like protein/PAS domain S-box-containing protein
VKRRFAVTEDQYLWLLGHSLVPICLHDGQSIVYINRVGVQELGAQSRDQILGRSIHDFVHPDSVATLECVSMLREDGDTTQPTDLVLRRLDGTAVAKQFVATLARWRGQLVYEVIFRAPLARQKQGVEPPIIAPRDVVIMVSRDGVVTAWNAGAEAVYGRKSQDVLGQPIDQVVGAPLDIAAVTAAGGVGRFRHLTADGAVLIVRVVIVETADGFALVVSDETAAQQMQTRFREVLDCLHEGVVIMGGDGRFQFTNAAARHLLGASAEELVGMHRGEKATDLPIYDSKERPLAPETHPINWIQQTGLALAGGIVGIDRNDGQRLWVKGQGCLLDSGDPENSPVLLSFIDITEHYIARRRLSHDATHDELTGLPNRALVVDRVAKALDPDVDERLAAVLFIDLDKLKAINDSHGHTTGDDLIRIAAQRMRSVMRHQDVLARFGGDEFVAVLFHPINSGGIDGVAMRLHQKLGEPLRIHSLDAQITASIGVTTIEDNDARNAAQVLRDADTAMYDAKANGPGKTCYFTMEEH